MWARGRVSSRQVILQARRSPLARQVFQFKTGLIQRALGRRKQPSGGWRTFGTSIFDDDADDDSKPATSSSLLYESPLGTVVTRLRTVSIASGICGSIGLPLAISLKGGDLPSTGLLATGLMFCMMTLGSTAAIHYVFHPYVYEIHKIPVRVCSYEKNVDGNQNVVVDDEALTTTSTAEEEATVKGPFLFKAVSKSLFLKPAITIFDPDVDLAPYKGLRPMCNFTAKGVPLYVHPQQVFNKELRDALHFLTNIPKEKPQKENPDDFL